MSTGKRNIDPTDGDFYVNNPKLYLSTKQATWTSDFNITMEGNVINWRLTLLRSVYDKCIVYLTFVLDKGEQHRDKINVKCDFHIKASCLYYYTTVISKNLTTTNIYPMLERFVICSFPYSGYGITFEMYGTMSEIPTISKFPINIVTIPTIVLSNLEALFIEQMFCDVSFETADTRVSAHKNILAAQSPVFKRMFSTNMKEVKPGIVIDMKNVEGVILKEMLRFMYGGRVENIEQIADKLLILANKYEIEPLMTLCEKVLYDKLTISNAISTLKIADIHNTKNLRRLTEEFIMKNRKYMLETAEFKSLISTNPEMVIDILKSE